MNNNLNEIQNKSTSEIKTEKHSVIGLAFSIISILFGFVSVSIYLEFWYLNLIAGIIGVTLSGISLHLSSAKSLKNNLSIIGLTLSCIGIVECIIHIIGIIDYFGVFTK